MSTPNADPDATARIDSAMRFLPRYASMESQFAPGSIITGRYRIAGILGAGGMGEVYRADDIKLGQPVALKFLPARLARDPLLLARLHDEVRHGRQVSHPNVCRIYDIGEWEGTHFVAMELVDGEDLARLLRRIGHLPHEKAVEIARGIAAGLMAAHAKGILHRDLKPANVMIDSHGDARITDFGLALTADEDQEGEVAGTPAYMAPEQLRGEAASVQSDLYALGLVLYELFTGKRAHAGRTLQERVRDATTEIARPSSHIRDLDPAVERIILRCLAEEPSQRPRSARAIIEALPGGDPLAAAMAAGETPSPRIVAAAGTEGSLSRGMAWLLLGTAAALFTLLLVARRAVGPDEYVPFPQPPEVLAARGDSLLRQFGFPLTGRSVGAFQRHEAHLAWLDHAKRWASLRNGPSPVVYRREHGITVRQSLVMDALATSPGYSSIEVDTRGRLALLVAAPPAKPKGGPIDWRPVLAAAGLDGAALRPREPSHAPLTAFDTRAAWSGTYPGDTIPIRVEAAAWHGTPVYFRIMGPWDASRDAMPIPFVNPAIITFVIVVVALILLAGMLLAWRNLRLRRGDRQGALRVTITVFAIFTAGALLSSYYAGDFSDAGVVIDVLGDGLLRALIAFLLYVALEPHVRRRWPALLIASSRLLTGRFRDPMVGRDVLIGLSAGLLHAGLALGSRAVEAVVRGVPSDPGFGEVIRINGARFAVGHLLRSVASGLLIGFLFIVLLVVLAMVLRKRVLAIAALSLLLFAAYAVATGGELWLLPVELPIIAAIAFVTVRYGLLANAVAQIVFGVLFFLPVAGGVAWARPLTMIYFGSVVIVAVWAFRTALGGQAAFATDALD